MKKMKIQYGGTVHGKEEIDASINLYRLLKATMELNLAEKQIA